MIVNMALTLTLAGLTALPAAELPRIYVPEATIADQQISLKPYGSGIIVETDDTAYEGTQSIRISSRNFFQGGSFMLGKPANLGEAFGNKANLLFFAFRLPDNAVTTTTNTGGGGGGAAGGGPSSAGGAGGAGGGGSRGGGLLGGGGDEGKEGGGQGRPGAGAGAGGAAGGGTTTTTTNVTLEPLTSLRLVVGTSDGLRSEVYVPVSTSSSGAKGWRTIGVPLQAIAGLERTNKTITSISFSGNTTATFYIGAIRVQNDETPIYGETNHSELNIGTDSSVNFTASGFGGMSILKYTWDFDASDGITVDSEGQNVTKRFRKPGNYTVTLTISDTYGLKKPFSRTIKVVVN